LQRGKKEKNEKKKENKQNIHTQKEKWERLLSIRPAKQLPTGSLCSGFQGIYVPQKTNLKVSCTLCAPYVLEVSYLAKMPNYPNLAATNLKFSFRLMKAQRFMVYWLSTIFVSFFIKCVYYRHKILI
jgi:hypothetical protein